MSCTSIFLSTIGARTEMWQAVLQLTCEVKIYFGSDWQPLVPLSPFSPPQPANHPVPPVPAGGIVSPAAPGCPCWTPIGVSAWLPVHLVPISTTQHTVAVSITGVHVPYSGFWIAVVSMLLWLGSSREHQERWISPAANSEQFNSKMQFLVPGINGLGVFSTGLSLNIS